MLVVKSYGYDGSKVCEEFDTALEAHKEAIALIEDEDISLVEIYELMSEYTKTSIKGTLCITKIKKQIF